MALVTCKDCNKEFSNDAKRCPNCGAKKLKLKNPKKKKWFIWIGAFVMFSYIYGEIKGNLHHTPVSDARLLPYQFADFYAHRASVQLCGCHVHQ